MGFGLGKLAKIAAPMVANYFVPGSGALVSGMMQGSKTKKGAQQAYADALRAARPNQMNAGGDTLNWSVDPTTGRDVQTTKFSPEHQAQYDAFNRIATGRMGKAEGMTADLPTGKIDYDKMGLGSLASAFGIGQGTTGKRPWADREYSSLGGDALNFLQFSEGQGGLTPTQTWGSRPVDAGAPSGGGAALSPPPPGPDPAALAAEEQRKKALAMQTGGGAALMGG